MGVHGLWELLAPVGRRVSVETLAGKKLAIDASIWMIQFMKAMRDEKGEMVRNAHILGFFRRICKLLYLRTKPVFVFDGGTPALKRRTVIARRRQRENAQAKIRKTAEKLLLNHVKAMRLKELAADLENQRPKNDIKGKKAIREESNMEQKTDRGNDEVAKNYSQEELDEMLAASLAAEENERFTAEASTSGVGILGDKVYRDEGGDEGEGEGEGEDEDEDEDEDEEMILPEMHGKVDPAVLAALPPSMQLDLLVQMRERLMAENRQKYQKVKKAPTRFSELQIQAYLKTVAFRREIDGVQKSAIGRGIGGVQTSRIASEANREFIFSTSFTGDKETLTSVGQERNNGEHNQNPPINSFNSVVNEVSSTTRSVATKGLNEDETGKGLHHDVNTYLDERGRLRVSRVRALGIRMTRDLQRNLDLMKEIEEEKADANQKKHSETTTTKTLEDVLCNTSDRIEHQEVGELNNDGTNDEDTKTEDPAVEFGTTLEISFEDTGDDDCGNDDDDLFATLVAGDPVVDFSIDNSTSLRQSLHSNSDCEWEEGVIEDKSNVVGNHNKAYNKPSLLEGRMSDEVEIEWDEGSQCIQVDSSFHPHEMPKIVTKGALVEEAEFQEAIRRSLQDMIDQRPMNKPHEGLETGRAEKIVSGDNNRMSVHEPEVQSPAVDPLQPLERTCSTNVVETEESAFAPCMEFSPAKSHLIQNHFDQETVESGALAGETFVASDILLEEKYLCRTKEQMINVCGIDGNGHVMNKPVDTRSGELAHNGSSAVSSSFADSFPDRLPDRDLGDAQHGGFHEEIDAHSCKTAKSTTISANDFITDADCTKDLSLEKGQPIRNHTFMDVDEEHEVNEDYLEEEMLFLDKEREELGSEQRKLERNAESVSSEMFAECQELLQMFGLPYIIAPMEAEAQCANMEFVNLVDGVVTDDSDAFLFGARSVYKNIFDDRKYVETYFMKDIENELGLNREKIISMALLLGSDYTEGVSGIGIVNAIEVVNAFPEQNGLREFREWIESPDPTILGSIDVLPGGKSKRKGSKSSETITSSSSSKVDEISCDQNDNNKMKQIFMDKHRNVSKNWHIPSSFPSDAVIQAYTSPQVDKSTEPFSWGKPDLFLLRKLCWEKFGWGSSKADDLLLPVLKEYNKHETQLRLEAFYTFNERFAKIRSKRIKKAVKGITGNKSSELLDEGMPQQSGIGKKRKVKPSEEEAKKSRVSLKGPECAGTSNQISTTEEPKVEQSKRGWRKEKSSELGGSNLKQSVSRDPNLSTRKELHKRGRQKEQGRGKQTRRGRKKQNDSETSHDDADNGSYSERERELQFDNSEESCHVRRSARFHKAVNYTLSDESDYCEKSELDGGTTKDLCMEEAIGGKETDVNEVEDLGIGGESFVDETAPVNTTGAKGTSQDDDCFRNSEVNECLQLGGGFCLDEEDGNTEFDGQAPSPTRETTSEKSDVLTSFDHVEEGKPESGMLNLNPTRAQNGRGIDASDTQSTNNDDSRVSNTVLLNSLDDTENEPENYSVRYLRAMPNLRRKKRRT